MVERGAKRANRPEGYPKDQPKRAEAARQRAETSGGTLPLLFAGDAAAWLGGARALTNRLFLSRVAGVASPAETAGFRGETTLKPERDGCSSLARCAWLLRQKPQVSEEKPRSHQKVQAVQCLFTNGCSASAARQPRCVQPTNPKGRPQVHLVGGWVVHSANRLGGGACDFSPLRRRLDGAKGRNLAVFSE